MADVDLRLASDLSKLVQGFKDAQFAANKFHEDLKKQLASEKEILKDQERALKDIRKAWEQATPGRGKMKAGMELKEVNAHIEETKENIKGLTAEIEKTGKSKNKLTGVFKKFLGVGALVMGAYKVLKAAIASTSTTAEGFQRAMAGVKAQMDVVLKALATGQWENLRKRMKDAKTAAKEYSDAMAEASHAERALAVQRSEAAEKLYNLEQKMRDIEVSPAERQKALDDYMEIQRKFADQEIAIKQDLLEKTSEAVGAKVGIEGEALQETMRLYNEDKEVRKASLAAAAEYEEAFADRYRHIQDRMNEIYEDKLNTQSKTLRENLDKELEVYEKRKKALDAEKEVYSEYIKEKYEMTLQDALNMSRYAKNYKKLNEEELNMVSDYMRALAEANAIMERLGKERQRLQNVILITNLSAAKKEKEDFERLQAEWLKSEDEYLRKIAEMRRNNRLENIKDQEAEQQIIQQLVFDRGELLKLEVQMIEERQAKAAEALKSGIITKAEYEEIMAVDTIKEVHEAIELITIDATRKLAEIRTQNAEKERSQIEQDEAEKLKLYREWRQQDLELVNATEKEKLELKLEFLKQDRANLQHENEEILAWMELNFDMQIKLLEKHIATLEGDSDKFNLMKYLGISDEQLKAGKVAVREITSVLNDIFAERVKDAERTRSLLDRQIQETQNALNAEIALMEEGYASNVRAKQQEVERLQAEREKALADEERALAIQRRFDSIQQAGSLVTASTNLYQALSPLGVMGIATATALIAAMFAAFIKTKADADKLTKLERGGLIDEYGTVQGKRHSKGGERMLDHVEVEGGEKIGVFNRNASKKFDKQIRFAVERFNAGEIPYFAHMPNMPVQVNAFADTRKLHDIDKKLGTLNAHFENASSVVMGNGARIERRKNFTRVIHG